MEKFDLRPHMETWKEGLQEEQAERERSLRDNKKMLKIYNAKLYCIREVMGATREDDTDQLTELIKMQDEVKNHIMDLAKEIDKLEKEINIHSRLNLQLFVTIDENSKQTN
ncbi:hypothetical protein [Bacillus pseudomycoides]|uniref:hypothetical protein n=1 Tax=Bacillus pseudomycoides TaxID=64104 RepID=UPI000BF6EEA0|nr:hypothetical protein [Bacillus pseudomycoides]PFX49716.1 hypothetical protein COL31_18225 [Bacillus pseudomycoides]PFZ84107.1 hypothetical protein COL69_08775 [Bacillus pseudomycoides]PGE15771.1 hypothetical protein COM51_18910 [Bacillus pseudomycoides]